MMTQVVDARSLWRSPKDRYVCKDVKKERRQRRLQAVRVNRVTEQKARRRRLHKIRLRRKDDAMMALRVDRISPYESVVGGGLG